MDRHDIAKPVDTLMDMVRLAREDFCVRPDISSFICVLVRQADTQPAHNAPRAHGGALGFSITHDYSRLFIFERLFEDLAECTDR